MKRHSLCLNELMAARYTSMGAHILLALGFERPPNIASGSASVMIFGSDDVKYVCQGEICAIFSQKDVFVDLLPQTYAPFLAPLVYHVE